MKPKTKKILIFGGIAAVIILWLLKNKLKQKPDEENEENKTNMEFTSPAEYIKIMYPIALKFEASTGIPHLFFLAQTALETGWGKSSLVREANNFGGIKARDNQPFVLKWTTEHVTDPNKYPNRDKSKDTLLPSGKTSISIQSKFAKYPNITSGLIEYTKILLLPRYKEAFKFTDPIKFAEVIKAKGYATGVNYVSSITQMINTIKKYI